MTHGYAVIYGYGVELSGKAAKTLDLGLDDLPGLMDALKAINFHGYMAIEYEGEPENPIPALIAGKEEVFKLI